MTDETDTTTKNRRSTIRGAGKPCGVEGCTKDAYYASGLCAMHERRLKRTGSPGQAAPMRKHEHHKARAIPDPRQC